MTIDPREYHRTFKILRLSGRTLGPADFAPDMDELKEARAKYRGLPDRQALDLLRADKLRNRLPVHDAVEDTGSQYRPARIEEKRDQNFERFATPWELIWSRLVMYWESRLTPVVDSSGSVINYTGNIDYKYFLIDPANQAQPSAEAGMDPVEVLKRYRLFVGTNSFYGRKDLQLFGSDQFGRHTVVTDIYGEVMSYTVGERNDDSITKVGLLEIWGGLTLARDALRLVTALGKTGVRTLTRRPPASLPSLAAGSTSKGMTLHTNSVAFQGRKALVLGDDMVQLMPHVNKIPSEAGLFDLIVHGDRTGFHILKNGVWQNVSVRDIADSIRSKLGPNDKIRLIGCETGVLGGPAQQLANDLGRNVFAPTTSVYPMLGTFYKASHPRFNTINGVVYESVKGHLTEVMPDKFGKYVASRGGELVKFVSGKSIVPIDGGTFTEIYVHRGAAQLAGQGRKVIGNELQGEIPGGKR